MNTEQLQIMARQITAWPLHLLAAHLHEAVNDNRVEKAKILFAEFLNRQQ